jgi:multisubunit Na+/H+ antiporter MnhB subunit
LGVAAGPFLRLHTPVIEVLALFAVAVAIWRRDRVTLALAAGAVAWVIIEIAFVLHGWPGVPRYMFEAAGVVAVLAGAGFGWLLSESRRISSAAPWVGIVLAVVVLGALLPPAVSRARSEHADILAQRRRTDEINRLTGVINSLGGAARLRACGEPLTRLEYQSILAYQLGVNVSSVGFKYSQAIAHDNPIVLFTPYSTGVGWQVQAMHQTSPSCQSLPH